MIVLLLDVLVVDFEETKLVSLDDDDDERERERDFSRERAPSFFKFFLVFPLGVVGLM